MKKKLGKICQALVKRMNYIKQHWILLDLKIKPQLHFYKEKLQIGYNRAARIIDTMEADGIVSKANHVGKRDIL